MRKKLFIAVATALFLAGCGGGGSSSVVTTGTVTGAGQKGPFSVGSSVTLCQLNTNDAACTSTTMSTTTTDNKGFFSASPSWRGWTQVTISGKSFNEYTGAETTTSLSLDAIVSLAGSADRPRVNLFTHLLAARVRELVKTMSISAAYYKAQNELQTTFGLESNRVEDLDILDGDFSLAGDNAILLTFSAAFHAINGNATTLSELSADFANNANFDDYDHFKNMRYATAEGGDTDGDGIVDQPNAFLNKVSANLVANRYTSDAPNGADAPTASTFQLKPDELATQQWHLEKINIADAQTCAPNAKTCRGEGILIGVIDDSLEIAHEDLKDNIANKKSRNFNETDKSKAEYYDPTSRYSAHGTAVAGLIAAVDQNGKGVRGVAPRASLAGFNAIGTDDVVATSTALGNKELMISNNSWGPHDNVCIYQDSSGLDDAAIESAVVGAEAARDGRGAIILFAVGNGGEDCGLAYEVSEELQTAIGSDQASMDGFINNRYVIPVTALARNNANSKAVYAEPGVNILVAAPAGNYCTADLKTLVTTDLSGDLGNNSSYWPNDRDIEGMFSYTGCMNGTSGATPITAGVVALMLQANPNLTWRDVRAILAKSATQNDSSDAGWATNTVSNMKVHRYYGYGMVNAAAAVAMAKTWVNLPVEKSLVETPNRTLTPGDNGTDPASHTVSITSAEFDKLETVQVEVEFNHQRAGDIELVLEHRNDDDSLISTEFLVKLNADDTATAKSFTFTSAQHLYDRPQGKWVLIANDRYADNTGSVTWKSIKFFGHTTPN
ncbi:MAG: S8 family serine peptidase [Candidatus Thiothrix moscowensis]|nr:S8 family serine peptidase [Candidatus Thiothrix moscowensis]